ncbi:MAG: hypothetical protein U1F25_16740 [Rubrivivax sp.]
MPRARSAPRARSTQPDGYLDGGAAQDLGTYETLGSLKTRITDWHLFLNVANIQVIGVNPEDALQHRQGPARRDEGQAGPDQRRHRRRHVGRPQRDELIAKVTGVKYRHVTYDGGNPPWWPRWPARPK